MRLFCTAPRAVTSGGRADVDHEGLFFQLVMLAQFRGYRVGHDLTSMDLGRLAPVNSGMPACFKVAVNGHPEIAGADPLLHDIFKLERCLFLPIHAVLLTDRASRPAR
jgi:hypothetical protein